jgi:hypothetical protein
VPNELSLTSSSTPITWQVSTAMPPGKLGTHEWTPSEGHIITLPPHASTTTKAHELAHVKLGHTGVARNVDEVVSREIDAQYLACEWTGRKYTFNNFLDVVGVVVDQTYSDHRPNEIYKYMLEIARRHGLDLTKNQQGVLWRYIKATYDRNRGKG